MPVERWTFHMSVAYCSKLEATAWQEVMQLAETFQVPTVHEDVSVAEVVAFDEGREYSGGMYALGTNTTAPP
jgi:hypothetical protein